MIPATVPLMDRVSVRGDHGVLYASCARLPCMSLQEFGYKEQLNRALTPRDLIIYGMIFMVPIAPFGVFGFVWNEAKGMVPLAYLLGLIGMFFTALSYAAIVLDQDPRSAGHLGVRIVSRRVRFVAALSDQRGGIAADFPRRSSMDMAGRFHFIQWDCQFARH